MNLKLWLSVMCAGLFGWLFFFPYQPAWAQQSPDSPVTFTGSKLPVPPLQNQPWAPPASKLPESFVSATRWLFKHGMADPRGCEYREIEVMVGRVRSGRYGKVKVHGWVLPFSKRVQPSSRFAVCWNGLVYPVQWVGNQVDLVQDVKTGVEKQRQYEAQYSAHIPNFPYSSHGLQDEFNNINHQSIGLLKAVLLLRLGRPGLAFQIWKTLAKPEVLSEEAVLFHQNVYLHLAAAWVWAMFDRGVCAHIRGDDGLARVSLRQVATIQPQIEAEAKNRKLKPPNLSHSDSDKPLPYLAFLGLLPTLLADQERRQVATNLTPHRQSAIEAGPDSFPTQQAWIAALIHDLEDVAQSQTGQPGWADLRQSPIVQALIAEGEPAIDALIQTIETDTRLTRSVVFPCDFLPYRGMVPVREAAYEAVCAILNISFGSLRLMVPDSKEFQALLINLRTYWGKYKNIPVAERWFQTLADDKATPDEWLQAASNIVRLVDIIPFPHTWASTRIRKPGETPTMQGEALRTHQNPSVSEVITRRAQTLLTVAIEEIRGSNRSVFKLRDACSLAVIFSQWDRQAALPVLQEQMQCNIEVFGQQVDFFDQTRLTALNIARLTLSRIKCNDASQALQEYVQWIQTVAPKDVGSNFKEIFEPLWQKPDHPDLAAVAEWMFNDPQSPWNPMLKKRDERQQSQVEELLQTPLIRLAGFRKQLIRLLDDTSQAGVLKITATGELTISSDVVTGSWSRFDPHDATAFWPAGVFEFRIADYWAWKLFQAGVTQECQLYWPLARRDGAIAQARKVLER